MVNKAIDNEPILIQGAPGGSVNGCVPPAPRSFESFSKCLNDSIESASNPKTETSFRGFVGAVVKVAREGMYKFNNE